ncbi:MAG: hypothetical protein WCH21_03655 [Bacteroidota bacterium]
MSSPTPSLPVTPELFEALVDECKAAMQVSMPEGQGAINATLPV